MSRTTSTGKWQTASTAIGSIADDDYVPESFEEERQYRFPFPPWHLDARCVGEAEEVFFGTQDARPALSPADIRKAKAICSGCPVRKECLTHALKEREKYGVWAGTSGKTRSRIFAMLDERMVTIEEVVSDFLTGNAKRYERRAKVLYTEVVDE